MQAKFEVSHVTHHANGCASVTLHAVTRPWPVPDDHPNKAFWEATPTGELTMALTVPGASDFFVPGQAYLLEFTPDK